MKDFYNKDFEEYVQTHADQHRMVPSDKIWKSVHKSLHPRRKWYGAGLAVLLLMTGSAVTWVMNSYPLSRNQQISNLPNVSSNNTAADRADRTKSGPATANGSQDERGLELANVIAIDRKHRVSAQPADISTTPQLAGSSKAEPGSQPLAPVIDLMGSLRSPESTDFRDSPRTPEFTDKAINTRKELPMANTGTASSVFSKAGVAESRETGNVIGTTSKTDARIADATTGSAGTDKRAAGSAAGTDKSAAGTAAGSAAGTVIMAGRTASADQQTGQGSIATAKAPTPPLLLLTADDPFTIENITNSYKAAPKKVSWQIFVTPTVSYRVLHNNHGLDASNLPGSSPLGSVNFPFATLSNVNNAVQHKPDFGLQVGTVARYPLSRNLRLRAGLQFNMNRYDIKAYAHSGEIAQIELDGAIASTVSAWTRYRSQGNSRLDWLKNIYYSASLPVGMEVTLFRNNRRGSNTSVGIAGTVQPTWVIKDKTYLISTDYKNYAQVPWLNRSLNVNTGLEAFVNFGKKGNQWQIGPQVRYQLLSSYNKKYPVRENLFDFGLKVGVTLNK